VGGQDSSSVTSINLDGFNSVQFGVCPVDAILHLVDCQTIGPLKILIYEIHLVSSIKSHPDNGWLHSPVGIENVPGSVVDGDTSWFVKTRHQHGASCAID